MDPRTTRGVSPGERVPEPRGGGHGGPQAGGQVSGEDAASRRGDQECRALPGVPLLGVGQAPVRGLVPAEGRLGIGGAASASARVNAPAIARVDPSPNSDTQEEASPRSATRPFHQRCRRTWLTESK
ncbi:hypothetical protein GCM10027612_63140 [Microbispora bryophytorum subsp. camponoti]